MTPHTQQKFHCIELSLKPGEMTSTHFQQAKVEHLPNLAQEQSIRGLKN